MIDPQVFVKVAVAAKVIANVAVGCWEVLVAADAACCRCSKLRREAMRLLIACKSIVQRR